LISTLRNSCIIDNGKLTMLNAYQSLNKSEFELKIKETETCHSMGLFNEAFSIYQQALSMIPVEEKKT
jgi:hypothetical protein